MSEQEPDSFKQEKLNEQEGPLIPCIYIWTYPKVNEKGDFHLPSMGCVCVCVFV